MLLRRVLGWLLVVALAVGACGSDGPASIPAWDFFGAVASVDFEEPRVDSDELHRGGPDSEYLSGAMTITLDGGLVLEIPTGTPGGNSCRDLASSGARNEECVIAGSFDDSGAVAWFELLDVVNTAANLGGGRHVEVFGIEGLDGDGLTIRGLAFPVSSDVTIECSEDAATLPEAIAADLSLMADVSIAHAEVISVWCLYEQ